jgi:hypothetical protein
MIDLLLTEYARWSSTVPSGMNVVLRQMDDDYAPRTARLDAESKTREAQVIVWDTGEVDIVIGDSVSAEILTTEHREVTSEAEMQQLLLDIRNALLTSSE